MKKAIFEASPNDSRYIPFTQQPYCCVPTSIQMIMYRNSIPLVPAEEIGYHLGLTVTLEDANYFYNVRSSATPPAESGFGTNISRPEYEPNTAFKRLGIPLSFQMRFASTIASEESLLDSLRKIEADNTDALLCFNHGVIRGQYEPNSGHVVVFDKIINGQVRVLDASPRQPKWRLLGASLLFDALQQHGDNNSGGIWNFFKTK